MPGAGPSSRPFRRSCSRDGLTHAPRGALKGSSPRWAGAFGPRFVLEPLLSLNNGLIVSTLCKIEESHMVPLAKRDF